jgi:hypothetical protein
MSLSCGPRGTARADHVEPLSRIDVVVRPLKELATTTHETGLEQEIFGAPRATSPTPASPGYGSSAEYEVRAGNSRVLHVDPFRESTKSCGAPDTLASPTESQKVGVGHEMSVKSPPVVPWGVRTHSLDHVVPFSCATNGAIEEPVVPWPIATQVVSEAHETPESTFDREPGSATSA